MNRHRFSRVLIGVDMRWEYIRLVSTIHSMFKMLKFTTPSFLCVASMKLLEFTHNTDGIVVETVQLLFADTLVTKIV